jgi:tetratricopeptide (TPR) repeat protein
VTTVDDTPGVDRPDAPGARREGTGDERWHLADEREFLRRSLEDAAREHEAGDLSDEDHALLVARDTTRLAEVEAELDALGEPGQTEADETSETDGAARRHLAAAGEPSRPDEAGEGVATSATPAPRVRMALWRKVGIVVACGFIVLGAVILVAHFVQARQPGQASSGSISQTQAQQIEEQLQQALALNNSGNVKGALELYNKVLGEDPSNPAALAYAGYLEWDEGSAAHVASLARIGRAQIETAIKDAPTYYEAHLFYGLVLANQDHNDKAAVVQFDEYLNDGPPPAEPPKVEAQVLGAYQAANEPVPAAFTSGAPPTSRP